MIKLKYNKKKNRLLRAYKTRIKIIKSKKYRLSIYKSNLHIYIKLINLNGKILFSSSTIDKNIKNILKKTKNKKKKYLLKIISINIINKLLKFKINNLSFDRSGFKYHGNIKKIAEYIRNNGLLF